LRFLLDTNIIVYTLKNRFESIRIKIENAGIDNVCVSSLTVAEMEFGAAKSQNPDSARARLYEFLTPFEVLSFDAKAAEFYGRIRATMEKTGNIIGPMDLLIASIAVANDCCVVTHNTKEFVRVPNLKVEDWTK
jgi:tRNA(fMet)-specific endonuclease VapC